MTEGERVRFCLSCGEVVSFDERACPACGHYDPIPAGDTLPTARCGACGKEILADLFFCSHCGRETSAAPPMPDLPRVEVAEEGAGATATLTVALAWLAPLVFLAAVVLVALSAR